MKWTEEELDILMLCIKSELTRSATIERCVKEGIMRSDGAISKKRLELKRTLEEEVDIVDDVVEEETADFNSEEEEEVVVEKIKKSKKEFFYALLLAAGMTYLLLESGYIDWN